MCIRDSNCDECTFAPDLTTTKGKRSYTGPAEVIARDVERAIERLRRGRQEREVVAKMKERGLLNNSKTPAIVNFDLSIEKSKFKCFGTQRPQSAKNAVSKSLVFTSNTTTTNNANINVNVVSQPITNVNNGGRAAAVKDKKDNINVNQALNAFNALGLRTEVSEDGNIGRFNTEEDERRVLTEEVPLKETEGAVEGEVPLLFVDVNLGAGRTERIVVHEGDLSEDLARKFVEKHGLDAIMINKLKELLDTQINNLLHRIDEEDAPSHISEAEEDQSLSLIHI
eukprot:TRINITY_DN17662_c0_g1_i1.p2 TRINITY_DN17662_c0_g1~~TRINITY_DN17662_c0_g1_i1.p2  ORF type:complete len:300 (-),score=126.59 TRINITY_DN17662_c0_g1_i1:25-873(-)